jgi:hypothetical protein
MKNLKTYSIIGLISVGSFLIGRYVVSPKKEIKEVIKYVTVEVEKKQTKKTTKVSETKRPDGTTNTETTVVEETASTKNTSTTGSKETYIASKRGLIVGISALKDLDKFQEKTQVGANVAVPIIGNLFVTGSLDTSKRVGLGIALEF